MKAMLLAAGLGTRLRPYTDKRPKALFSLNRKPVLELAIEKIRDAGFQSVMVNTHHCHRQVEEFIAHADFGIAVETRHETELLGTGGALSNVADYWRTGPLLVINADIVSDIDLAAVYRFHARHDHPVTMVMHDNTDFNSVAVNDAGFITRFHFHPPDPGPQRSLAFTGIHIIDTRVLDFLPRQGSAHIIDAYSQMLAAGEKIKAYISEGHVWYDIGAPRRYRRAAIEHMAPLAFQAAFGSVPTGSMVRQRLRGDGSDRRWYRFAKGGRTMVMADHGISRDDDQQEVDAYIAIGRHLERCAVPVPRIYLHDRCSGLVFMEDLGDQLLHDGLARMKGREIEQCYRRVIDTWITMAMEARQGFDTAWTYQSAHYDRDVILDNECHYFMQAFIRDYLGWKTPRTALESEFGLIADGIEKFAVPGFMHRDFQSRNIMLQNGKIYFVDFQAGRLGPLQYDLASLLIDPYAALPAALQQRLLAHGCNELERRYAIDPQPFRAGYRFCALSRNLQILGAYAYLTTTRDKTWFADYIPGAIQSLNQNLSAIGPGVALPGLEALVEKLLMNNSKMFKNSL